MIKDYFKFAYTSMSHRRMRSWLTMIGIFIGIAAVIAVVSLGQGLTQAVNDQFSKLGNDKIFLRPGGSAFGGATSVVLGDKDKRTVDSTQGVSQSIQISYTSARLEYKNQVAYELVIGYPLGKGKELADEIFITGFSEGRSLQNGDSLKAVLGYDFTQDKKIFDKRVNLYDKIKLNNQSFEVVGFMGKGEEDDSRAYLPQDAYDKVFNTKTKDNYKELIIKTVPGVDAGAVAENIKKALRNERNLKEGDEDFELQTAAQIQDSANTILNIVKVVIFGIAAISLLIGGIGIMNTMYTAVLERTNEIGIMKAIGARNSDVMLIFLIESGLLGLVGGAIGVLLGLGVAKIVEVIGTAALGTSYLRAWWSYPLIFGALAFSFLMGAVSGVSPAWQASRQKPVDSLRYE